MYDGGKRPDVSQAQSQKEKTYIIPTYERRQAMHL